MELRLKDFLVITLGFWFILWLHLGPNGLWTGTEDLFWMAMGGYFFLALLVQWSRLQLRQRVREKKNLPSTSLLSQIVFEREPSSYFAPPFKKELLGETESDFQYRNRMSQRHSTWRGLLEKNWKKIWDQVKEKKITSQESFLTLETVILTILGLLNGFMILVCWNKWIPDFSLNYFFFFLFCLGVLTIVIRPFSWGFHLSSALDIGIGIGGVLLFLYHMMDVAVVPQLLLTESENLPCHSGSLQQRCYNVTEDQCVQIWNHIESSCQVESESIASNRGPTALVGPILKKCRDKSFDRLMKYNRKGQGLADPPCEVFFQYLKDLH